MSRIEKVLAEKRKAIAGVFLSVLYGLALQEMISPVRTAFRSQDFAFGDVAILGIFVLTVIRFFIGAQLYLWDDSVAKQKGTTWLFNFAVLVAQGILFTFLGGLTSRASSGASSLGFFNLLSWILVVDIAWISLVLIATLLSSARAKVWSSTPWQWAVLNISLIAITTIWGRTVGAGNQAFYAVLLGAHALAFLIDVWLVDHCGLLEASE